MYAPCTTSITHNATQMRGMERVSSSGKNTADQATSAPLPHSISRRRPIRSDHRAHTTTETPKRTAANNNGVRMTGSERPSTRVAYET
jgi:hypothetical protein